MLEKLYKKTTKFNMGSIDNNIRVERARLKISQFDLAKEMKVTRQTIYSLENNKFVPSVELALKLARYFNMEVGDLFWLVDDA